MQTYIVRYTTKVHHAMEIQAHDEFDAAHRIENIAGREVYAVLLVLPVNKFKKEE